MTKEEAIKKLKYCKSVHNGSFGPALKIAIKALEQPKTGHWIKIGDRDFGYSDIVICKCSECEYQKEFTGKFDGKYLIVDSKRAYKYCPNCGANMQEVEE